MRYAIRSLLKAREFTLINVAIIAIAIGATVGGLVEWALVDEMAKFLSTCKAIYEGPNKRGTIFRTSDFSDRRMS